MSTTTTSNKHWCRACRKYHPVTHFPTKKTANGYVRDFKECRKARDARVTHQRQAVAA